MNFTQKHTWFRGLLIASLAIALYSCDFSQSIEKDLETGLTNRGKGLSCDQVYLSDGEEIIKHNTFIYGETFYVNFNGMDGFVNEGRSVFPDMQLLIVGENGDTALFKEDLYADYKEGIDFDPLKLFAEVTVADPMHSEANYTLYVDIRDKKGDGTFRSSLDFNIVRDDNIEVDGEQLSYKEIYLFSQQSGQTITDGRAGFNETIYLLFEGMDGFSVEDGQVQIGLSMMVRDAEGKLILEESDLFGDAALKYTDVQKQVAPNLILTGTQIANPVQCEIRIWDKRSEAWIHTSFELHIE